MPELSQTQIETLARPLVGMVQTITDFYKNPQNEKRYREWYKQKYGHYPKDEVKQ